MMFEVIITLSPEARGLLARAQAWPVTMMRGIARAHDQQNELTIGQAKLNKLSRRGPKTLGVVTNRLRSSLTRSAARISGDQVASGIGTNVGYAGVHEFGFTGTVQVKSFTRRVRSRDVAAIGQHGQPLKNKIIASGVTTVRAHAMRMNLPERSFIRSTLTERTPEYSRAISSEIVAAFHGGAP